MTNMLTGEPAVSGMPTGLRAGATQGLGRRAFLAVHADGLVNVTRWTVRLDQVPVWSAPRFAATVGADLGMRFP